MHIPILAQPDDVTCGPTSLHAVYQYWGHQIDLEQVIGDVNYLEEGGTLAVILGIDALRRGFTAHIYSYNLHVFDPSWVGLDNAELRYKLQAQLQFKKDKRFQIATEAYIQFLEEGGQWCFTDLSRVLLHHYLDRKLPVLAGLSATYLYQSHREYTNHARRAVLDDLRGEPVGHFVVLLGLENGGVRVADPYHENPISRDPYYTIDVNRLINAIMLGAVTYDANLLIIAPKSPA